MRYILLFLVSTYTRFNETASENLSYASFSIYLPGPLPSLVSASLLFSVLILLSSIPYPHSFSSLSFPVFSSHYPQFVLSPLVFSLLLPFSCLSIPLHLDPYEQPTAVRHILSFFSMSSLLDRVAIREPSISWIQVVNSCALGQRNKVRGRGREREKLGEGRDRDRPDT